MCSTIWFVHVPRQDAARFYGCAPFYGCSEEPPDVFIVLEFAEQGALRDVLLHARHAGEMPMRGRRHR
jgi:hypothetical protein